MRLQLRKKATEEVKKGRLLLTAKDFVKPLAVQEGEIIEVGDSQYNHYIASAKMAKQNKGVGWVFSYNEAERFDKAFFIKKLAQARSKRDALFADPETTAFRVFNGEGDGIGGITIDLYDAYLSLAFYSLGIYQDKEALVEALHVVFPEIKGIYEKIRFEGHQDPEVSHLISGEAASEPLIIKENGIQYVTYMNEGLMTGIFLDQREVRDVIKRKYAKGKKVLNTFSYTGAFSVASAIGGASETVSVDVANRSLEKTKEHFSLNQIPLDNHKIYVMDVFEYIKYAHRKNLHFDLIVLDPPSFARTKKTAFQVQKDYGPLAAELADLLSPNGMIICSTNASNYAEAQFEADIVQSFNEKGIRHQLVDRYRLPVDFPVPSKFNQVSDYLKVFVFQRK